MIDRRRETGESRRETNHTRDRRREIGDKRQVHLVKNYGGELFEKYSYAAIF